MWLLQTFLCVLLCVTLAASSDVAKNQNKIKSKIVEGEALDVDNLPYIASIGQKSGKSVKHFCGGSIISTRTILTAAHCVGNLKASNLAIRLGSTAVNENGTIYNIIKISKHPKYKATTKVNDIALIYTDAPITTGMQIKLAKEVPADGTMALVSGWGLESSSFSKASKYLRSAWVPITNHETCRKDYARVLKVTDDMVCAGYPKGGSDACQGDSGGPLVAGTELVGVVSWGVKCGQARKWGVYSSIAANRAWIDENTV